MRYKVFRPQLSFVRFSFDYWSFPTSFFAFWGFDQTQTFVLGSGKGTPRWRVPSIAIPFLCTRRSPSIAHEASEPATISTKGRKLIRNSLLTRNIFFDKQRECFIRLEFSSVLTKVVRGDWRAGNVLLNLRVIIDKTWPNWQFFWAKIGSPIHIRNFDSPKHKGDKKKKKQICERNLLLCGTKQYCTQ